MNIPRLLFRLLLGRRLPIASGTLEVPGVKRPVLIHRDRYGIPHIEAESEEDAWYGLGFCQGQDRAFQLETLLRVTRGTLAEIVGREGLALDRLSRRIGFTHSSKRQLEVLDHGVHAMLDAYAQGVAGGSTLGCKRKAHEFTLLRTAPSHFTAADVISIAKLQPFVLAANWDVELARLQILRKDGPEALIALDPAYPQWHPVSVPPGVSAGAAIDGLAGDIKILEKFVSYGGGSNNWALASSRTATGRPILANDVHLAPALPPQWYLAHVRTPQWTAAGASFVGTPAFLLGHNDVAAWGVTAGMVDNTDLFLEEIGPDGASVRQGDSFIPCEVRTEVIRVKGGEDVVEEVVVTPRGPIVGPALDGDLGAVSMRATWLDPSPVQGFLKVHTARSLEEFRGLFEEWPYMSLHVVYADTSDTIAYQLVGEAPRRRKGWGVIPLAGWDPDAGWEDDRVPFQEMPHIADPPGGIVASANNQPTPEGEGPFLGIDWLDGYRVARIFESLQAGREWDLQSVRALHMDQESIAWREMREYVLSSPVTSEEGRRAVSLLEGWDGVVSSEPPAAAVFELFLTDITRRTVEAKAPLASAWALGEGSSLLVPLTFFAARRVGHLVRLLREQPEGWFPETWDEVIAGSLAAAVQVLRKRSGDDQSQWAWGRIRPLTLRHSLGHKSLLGRVYNLGPFPKIPHLDKRKTSLEPDAMRAKMFCCTDKPSPTRCTYYEARLTGVPVRRGEEYDGYDSIVGADDVRRVDARSGFEVVGGAPRGSAGRWSGLDGQPDNHVADTAEPGRR